MAKVIAAGASGHGGAGRRRRPRLTTALSEINVVPMVDVMLVLLIIFMVAAPMMQQGLNVNLPQQRRAQAMPPQSDPIYVTVPLAFARNGLVQLGNESVRLEVLAERIRQRIEKRDDKQIFLRSDGQVTMQQVMNVMDRLKAGGVEKVGIVSQSTTTR
ncbi:MAG: ExbD/TolR family protein [Vicinamibacteraceae bacterium]